MSRFDVDRFEVPPDAELLCCICQGVLDQPKETPCRHVFCKLCIETWLQKHRTCPTCRGITGKDQLQNVLPLLQNMINRLKLRCANHAQGCPETWTTEHHNDAHDSVCPYKKILCKHRLCKKMVLRKNLAVHESTCDFAEGVCSKYCGLTVFVKKMRSHSCLAELKAKVKEQEGVIEDHKSRIQQLEDEVKTLREQLQQQDDWGDDDYYSDDDNGWEIWSAIDSNSQSNATNDNDSMVGFSENSEPYEPWSPQTYHLSASLDVVYRVTPPASPTSPAVSDSHQQEAPQNVPSSPDSAHNQSNNTPAVASDHSYFGFNDLASDNQAYDDDSDRSDDSYSQYSNCVSADDHSNSASADDHSNSASADDHQRNSDDDQHSQSGSSHSQSSRSRSRTPVGSDDQDSFGSWRSNPVTSEDDHNGSYGNSGSELDSSCCSSNSSSRVRDHGKFSHVNTSSSSESDSEIGHERNGSLGNSPKLPPLCLSDNQVTSSGLIELYTSEEAKDYVSVNCTRKRKLAVNEDVVKQGSSKKLKMSDKSGVADGTSSSNYPQSGETSGAYHSDSESENVSIRRSARRPKPVKDTNHQRYSSDSSDSDVSYRRPAESPSDMTISEEHMTDELSDSEREIFETVDKLLDRFCEDSNSSDGSWTPTSQSDPSH